MSKTVFYGFGAFVGQQTGTSTCSWWPDDPVNLNWDASLLVPVDLAKSPKAFRNGSIAQNAIQVDDHTTNTDAGLTEIGPTWPTGQTIGACWLESNYYNSLGANKPARIPPGVQCRDYELTSAIFWIVPPLVSTRFYGVHADITQIAGPLALTTIWQPGTSLEPGVSPAGSFWLDLATVASPIADGLTKIGIGAGEPRTGALFLNRVTAQLLQLRSPKIPKSQGSDFI